MSAALIVGSLAYKIGKTRGDEILKAGTKIQNINPEGRDFKQTFYGVYDKQSQRFFLQNFSSLSNDTVSILSNEKDLKIAGRGAMNKAHREVFGRKYSNPFKRETYFRNFGALNEQDRLKFTDALSKKGYHGFKDINDIMIGWGNTPTVFFDKDFKVEKSKKIDLSVARKINGSTRNGNVASLSVLGVAGMIPASVLLSSGMWYDEYDKEAKRKYNKPYKDLTKFEKKQVRSLYV